MNRCRSLQIQDVTPRGRYSGVGGVERATHHRQGADEAETGHGTKTWDSKGHNPRDTC